MYFRVIYFIKLGWKVLFDKVVEVVWGFFFVYVLVFVIIMLVLMGMGMDNISVFFVMVVCLNNLGFGLGEVVVYYGVILDLVKWLLMIVMVFGCLEIFILLVLFILIFWCG